MKLNLNGLPVFGSILAMTALYAAPGLASSYYIEETMGQNVKDSQMQAATSLVRASIRDIGSDSITNSRTHADYVLQPRLIHLGKSYVITVEKKKGNDVVSASQAKASSLEDLDRATHRAMASILEPEANASTAAIAPINSKNTVGTNQALGTTADSASLAGSTDLGTSAGERNDRGLERSALNHNSDHAVDRTADQNLGQTGSRSGSTSESYTPPSTAENVSATNSNANMAPAQPATTSQAPIPMVKTETAVYDHWTIGFGPFVPKHLNADAIMYDVAVGHLWEIQPQVALKVMGEGNFSSGSDDAQFYNLGAGGNYYFTQGYQDSPYVTGDIGYGYARSKTARAEGFSVGLGAGYEFFRASQTSMDIMIRYNIITSDAAGNGYPSVLGARLAVNF